MSSTLVRLNKLLAEKGICSRREADRLIEKGLVRVNGVVANQPGIKVEPNADVRLSAGINQPKTILFHKPLGVISSQRERPDQVTAVECLTPDTKLPHSSQDHRLPPRLSVAGRLDVNSTGLLVLTQSGVIARQLIGPDSQIEKEYLVRVQQPLDRDSANEYVERLMQGVVDDSDELLAKHVSILNENQLKFILTDGKHHHVRRMCQAVNLTVQALKRVRIGQVRLGALPKDHWRYLEKDEQF